MIYQQVLNKIAEKYNIDMFELLKIGNEVFKNNSFSSSDFRQCLSIGLPVSHAVHQILGCDPKTAFLHVRDGNMSHNDFICIFTYIAYMDMNIIE